MTEEDQQDSATMARFNLPEYATDPAIGFYMEWLAVAEFLTAHFMGTGVLGMIAYLFKTGFSTIARSRESVHTAEPAAEGSEQRGIDRGDAQEGGEDSDGNDPLHVLRHVQLIAEMTLVRLVDYYLVYLTELLAMISRTRPHRLPHDRQISFGQVLQYENMDELRRAIADQYVRELSRKRGQALGDYFKKDLKLPLYTTSEDDAFATAIIQLRNLLVHNRGVVDEHFKQVMSDEELAIGERMRVDFGLMLGSAWFLLRSVTAVDARAAAEFTLQQEPCAPRLKQFDISALETVLNDLARLHDAEDQN